MVEAINGATTEEGAFVQGNRLQAGAFNYSLHRDSDESWYLRSENAYRAEVPLYASCCLLYTSQGLILCIPVPALAHPGQ